MASGETPRVVAVTGGASGIGAACATLFANRGCKVYVLDRDAGAIAQLRDNLPHAHFVSLDVSDAAAVKEAFESIAHDAGRLDVLVNSAGIESKALIRNVRGEDWDRVLDINLKGTMLCTQAAARIMKPAGGGSIVNIASVAGKRISYSGDAAYTASKSGVLGFTRHAAFEFGIDNIRVNAVCPGPTLTPMILRNLDERRIEAVVKTVPLGRWVMPEDIAEAVAFFAGPASAMCTGTSLDVDGGVLVSNGSRYEDYFAARE
ncbi:MAG TPA: SDR family NAD(P)-dependent oxidoreductase [Ramlibacter sp.]|uniref:SDR family NAD(P)-dependent oxidoreductase n=1 Tax=Ramlibacter sp. TaxID=1917967 RepID=UPI002BE66E91|nr:SDR family NAD(P)-dependent oxidoreductase [Ramlibacter sp.]HVZ42630.1 SDR family NAD(P)-dependent oxidoreductase [Ramlibacter sp.]